jgi:acetyl esterase/lipase
MQRQTAWWIPGLAFGGGALSTAAGALGLWARYTPWPLAAVLLPEAPLAAALPALVGGALALGAARRRDVDPPRHSCGAPASGPSEAKPRNPPAFLAPLGAAGFCLVTAAFAGWPLLVLPRTAARFRRAMDGLLGAAPSAPAAASRGREEALPDAAPRTREDGAPDAAPRSREGGPPDAAPRSREGGPPDAAPRGLLSALLGVPDRHTPGPFRRERGVVYRAVAGLDLALDLYLPLAPGPHPLVVVVHGGGWCSGDRRELPAFNRWLAGRGYAVAALDYRLAPGWTYPAPLEDVQAAVAFLVAHAAEYALDPARVVLVGRSAGGHLVLQAAYGDAAALGGARLAGVVAYYPPTDLVALARTPPAASVADLRRLTAQLLGTDIEVTPAAYPAASPLTAATRPLPPTLLIHGARDEVVPVAQSRALAAALERAGNRVAYLELPWSAHGFDFGFRGLGVWLVQRAVLRFLDAVLEEVGK